MPTPHPRHPAPTLADGFRARLRRFAALAGIAGALLGAQAVARHALARDAIIRIPASAAARATPVSLTAEIYRPEGRGRFPAVVMMHGCGGWQAPVQHALREHATFLRGHGFVVLNLDSFGPRGIGGGPACENVPELTAALRYRTQDAFDALRYLRTLDYVDGGRVFLMGQSNGGSVAMLAAVAGASRTMMGNDTGFRGVVAFYPWCGAYGTSRPQLEAPLLVLAGARDDWTPPGECQRMRSWGASLRVSVYPRAAHSFDVLAPEHRYLGHLVGYDPAATQGGRQEMLAFFQEHGGRAAPAGERMVRVGMGR